jgi:hypothetical protein
LRISRGCSLGVGALWCQTGVVALCKERGVFENREAATVGEPLRLWPRSGGEVHTSVPAGTQVRMQGAA